MQEQNEFEQLNLDFVRPLDSPEEYKERAAIFAELWKWVEINIYHICKHKGWTTKGRRDAELIFSIIVSLSGVVKALRKNNPMSKNIPGVTLAEEKLADAVIGIMDISLNKKWDLPKAIFLKLEFLKKMKYKHGSNRPL